MCCDFLYSTFTCCMLERYVLACIILRACVFMRAVCAILTQCWLARERLLCAVCTVFRQ